MINWKSVAKYYYEEFRFYREQFMLWVEAYNDVADVYMIDESWSAGPDCYSVTHITKRAGDEGNEREFCWNCDA